MPAKIEIHNKITPAVKLFAYCDFEDFFYVRYHRWYLRESYGNKYPVAHIESKSFDTKMSSNVLTLGGYIMNPKEGEEVIYIDGNPLNCVRDNLQIQPYRTHFKEAKRGSKLKAA